MEKSKEKNQELTVTASAADVTETDFSSPFILKGKTLQVRINDNPVTGAIEKKFKSEKEVAEIIMLNAKVLFGEHTILIDGKKIIPDFVDDFSPLAFLIDFKNPEKPKLYIAEVVIPKENSSHLYFRMTMIFAFLKKRDNKILLADMVAEYIDKRKNLRKELAGDTDKVITALQESIRRNPYILLITDNEAKELAGFRETYTDTWGTLLKPVIIRKFSSKKETLVIMSPDFDTVRINGKKKADKVKVNEENHFEGGVSEEIREVYGRIKSELLKKDSTIRFNPQKYYISMRKNRNLAFFHIGMKRINMVVMNPDQNTRKVIKHHEVKTLTEKVQKFWNGASCTIVLENMKHLNEVISLLKKLVAVA